MMEQQKQQKNCGSKIQIRKNNIYDGDEYDDEQEDIDEKKQKKQERTEIQINYY